MADPQRNRNTGIDAHPVNCLPEPETLLSRWKWGLRRERAPIGVTVLSITLRAVTRRWVIIKPDFTTLQYRLANGLPSCSERLRLILLRAPLCHKHHHYWRWGERFQCATGSFAAGGRAIKVTGATADNGTYLVSAITGGTSRFTRLNAGGAVTFTRLAEPCGTMEDW